VPDKKVILLNSGGLDSLVSAGILLGAGYKVRSLFFMYGQATTSVEYHSARRWIRVLQQVYGRQAIQLEKVELADYEKYVANAGLVSGQIPTTDQDPRLIFIPGRNIIFLLYAAIIGYNSDVKEIAFSSHKTDRVSGDCRPEFIEAFQEAIRWGMGTMGGQEPYRIWSPLGRMTKGEAVYEGSKMHLPLNMSWSCYKPVVLSMRQIAPTEAEEEGDIADYERWPKHCGVCHNCVDRIEAFKEAGIVDPTQYENR
jgi:7-cyano-7-deazaguanine synthase